MKPRQLFLSAVLLLAAGHAAETTAAEADRLKSDLVGQCMGGRERCWKFQSRDQIKELVVKSRKEAAGQRIYTVALRLMAERASGTFVGEARLVYTPQGGEWKLTQVGLLSLAKAE